MRHIFKSVIKDLKVSNQKPSLMKPTIYEKMKLIDELNRKLKHALTELIKKINETSKLVKK